MTKGHLKQKLRTVKIYFKTSEDLKKAIHDGLKLRSQNQYVRVEQLEWSPHIRHCTNCWRLGHSQNRCDSAKTCPHYGMDIDEGSHIICAENLKCRNRNGKHNSNQHNKCNDYKKRLNQITQCPNELQNGR